MKRVFVVVAVVLFGTFVLLFAFVPTVGTSTYPDKIQLSFVKLPASESLSCSLFGLGAGVWNQGSSYTYAGGFYQLGCPPSYPPPNTILVTNGTIQTLPCNDSICPTGTFTLTNP